MQTTYQQTIQIDATPEQIFSVLSDIRNLHTLLEVLGPAQDFHGDAIEVGDTWLLPQMHGGDPTDIEYEVTELNQNAMMELVGTSPYGICTYTWSIDRNPTAPGLTLDVCSELPEATDVTTANAFILNSKDWTSSALQRIKARAEREHSLTD